MWYYFLQGRRRLLKSGTAMERRSRFFWVSKAWVGLWWGGCERWMIPLVRGCAGRPQENYLIQDFCRSDSNAFWGISFLSYQANFTSISCISDANDSFLNPHQQCINNCFDPSVGLIKRWHQTWQFASNSDTDICCCFSFFFFFFFFGGGGGGGGVVVLIFFSSIHTWSYIPRPLEKKA